MPDYSLTHPLYDVRLPDWLESYDFARGGRHVLDPGRVVSRIPFLVQSERPPESGSASSERPRPLSRLEPRPVSSYLYSHPRESLEEYNARAARLVHIPLFRHAVGVYTAAALKTEPDRRSSQEGPIVEPWNAYWRDVDLKGTRIGAFNRQALWESLTFGLVFAVTDKPRFSRRAANRAEQLARGERAYTYLVRPFDLVNWRLHPQTGAFEWAVIREPEPDTRMPGEGFPDSNGHQYRVWHRDRWELWRETRTDQGAQDWTLVDGGRHPVGEVPIAVLFARRTQDGRASLDAESPLAGLQRVDRALMYMLSILHEMISKQAFAWVFIPDDAGGAPGGPIDVGPGIAIGFNSENGTPIMLSPESSLILAQWQVIAEQIQLAKEMHGLGRGKAEYSKEERSGDALMVESRNENNAVAALVENVEEFDHAIHRHVAKWEGEETWPQAEYTREVSLKGLSQQIGEVERLNKLGTPWETAKELIKPLIVEHMRHMGRSPSAIDAAISAIDAVQAPAVVADEQDNADASA